MGIRKYILRPILFCIKLFLISTFVLTAIVFSLLFFTSDSEVGTSSSKPVATVNDITGMNPVPVARIVTPISIEEIQNLLRMEAGPFSIGGGHFSMGGQTASEGTIHLDMRKMDRVLSVDPKKKQVTVESGATWHEVQAAIDPYNLSVKIMQSYASFTVGGSLSVNVHGRYIGNGPLVGSVDSIRVVLADGSLVEASRDKNPEIFFGVIGGYGGLGVIVNATLNLDDNVPVQRKVVTIGVNQYPNYFESKVRSNPDVVFQNGDLLPTDYRYVYSVSWEKTLLPVTESRRLSPTGVKPSLVERLFGFVILDVWHGMTLRKYLEPVRYRSDAIEWRNFEASYDVSDLSPISTSDWSYVLQEYFVPIQHFDSFVDSMREIFERDHVSMANVSIRHAIPDPDTLLSWARSEVFAFVLYYRQGTDTDSRREVGVWTRDLIRPGKRVEHIENLKRMLI